MRTVIARPDGTLNTTLQNIRHDFLNNNGCACDLTNQPETNVDDRQVTLLYLYAHSISPFQAMMSLWVMDTCPTRSREQERQQSNSIVQAEHTDRKAQCIKLYPSPLSSPETPLPSSSPSSYFWSFAAVFMSNDI